MSATTTPLRTARSDKERAPPGLCFHRSHGLAAASEFSTSQTLLLKSLFILTFTAGSLFAAGPAGVDFSHDVAPLLSRFGCNGSACHGKAEGQKGFKLSIFGNDPDEDYRAIVLQSRGRRISVGAPDASLFLQKAVAALPHAGGPRMRADSPEYRVLREWIAGGAQFKIADKSEVTGVRIEPERKVLGFAQREPLRVIASYSDGSEKDVTWLSVFHSNNTGIAEVEESGTVVTGNSVGQAAVMARFHGQIGIFQATIPRPGAPVAGGGEKAFNAIDDLVEQNLRRMNLRASGIADDAEFLRRVSLDVIGRLPTSAEAREFLQDKHEGKRARLVDRLLEMPEYADFWAMKWADLLRVDRQALGQRAAFAYFSWVRDSVAANKPLDQFAREMLTAEGPLTEQPAGYFYKVVKKSGEMAASTSQVFLGIRITCAECHQHPYDRWTQRDYHGMRAFFDQVKTKKLGDDEALVAEGSPQIRHPRTKELLNAHPLGTAMPETTPDGDRRQALATWLVASENPWFARNLANRFWAHFFGRGIIEPVDDVRASNPPSNPELLAALTRQLVDYRFDPKSLIRFITASRTYQTSSHPNETNENDEQNFSRAVFRRLPAEVLMDSVSDVTGVPEKFAGVPVGFRAVQLWDSQQQHYFLKLFGRPARVTACECERSTGASVGQALHLMNSSVIQTKLAHEGGNIARLASGTTDDATLADELYLSFFSRLPTDAEKSNATQHLAAHRATRRQAVEDLAWSMLNSLEFVFNH